MKLLFKNTTKYNKELYFKFNEFHNEKFGLKYEIYTLLLAILFLYCSIINFKNRIYYLGFLFIIILVSFIIWRFFRPVFVFKKEVKSKKISKCQSFTFCFYSIYLTIINKDKKTTLPYFKIKKVFEADEEFFLYLDKNHALLLRKDCFTIGNSNDFTNFIKKKCFLRYKKDQKIDKI